MGLNDQREKVRFAQDVLARSWLYTAEQFDAAAEYLSTPNGSANAVSYAEWAAEGLIPSGGGDG